MRDNVSFNFGAIRDTITRISASELLKENNSQTLDKFLSEIKKSPALVKQQFVYKNIELAKPFGKERLAERFIAQNMQLFKNENWNNILSENKKIRRELLDDIHIESRMDNKLSESINVLIEANSTIGFSDFERENEAYEYVMNHLTRTVNESDMSKEKTDNPDLKKAWKFITKTAVNNFNERYEHLNEEEKKVFSVLVADEKIKKSYLEEIKNSNISLIENVLSNDNQMNSESKSLLEGFKQKIENMNNVNFSNIDEYILSNIELKTYLED